MDSWLATLTLSAYALSLWLGLYLLDRAQARRPRQLTGWGLIAYAAALVTSLLSGQLVLPLLDRLAWALALLPALCWSGTLFQLLPEESPLQRRLAASWPWLLGSFGLLTAAWLGLSVLPAAAGLAPVLGWANLVLIGWVLLPLVLGFALVIRWRSRLQPRASAALLLSATLFLTLGAGLLLLPLGWLPQHWVVLSLGCDLALLGVAIAVMDAFDEGERLRPDLLRSLASSGGLTLLFGLPIALVASLNGGLTLPLLGLLLTSITTAVAVPMLAGPWQRWLDRRLLADRPQLQQEQAELRQAAAALSRLDLSRDVVDLDEAEFVRLTRRALSHYGDLGRLAASPLTRLPSIERRLTDRGAPLDTLARAAELKALLGEAIDQLKPRGGDDFGASDEWRHYNALYFPYVVGLKPYSVRALHEGLEPAALAALEWFQLAVPERTLHNWQTAAARLVARSLRERMLVSAPTEPSAGRHR